MNKNLLLVASALLFTLGQAAIANAQSATYRVTFEGEWTATATPGGVPSSAHFSPLIGAVHNDQVRFWSNGGTASAGIELMAETGRTSTLKREIASAGSNVHATLEKSVPFGGTPTATVEFTITSAHPLVTLVTMVAPSPDWFVGVSGLSLRENSDWLASKTVDLFPYDAGTEDGTEFSLSNAPTLPQGVITSIKGTGKFSNEPIATLTFTLQTTPNQAPTFTSSNEFNAAENQTAAGTVTANDLDPEDSVTYAIPSGAAGGADGAKFSIDGASGLLSFKTAPDFENPADANSDNEYIVVVRATGGAGDRAKTTDQTIAVTVTDVSPEDEPVDKPTPPQARAGDGAQSELNTAGASSGAEFTGGATINGGVSYLAEVPSSEPADLVVSFRPAARDVGREANVYVVLNVPGQGFFQKLSGGIWLPLNLADLETLRPYASKTLGERETITVVDGLVGDDANMAGMTIGAHVAYAVDGNLAAITYNDAATPARLSIAAAAGADCPKNTAADPEGGMLDGKPVCVLSGRITSHTHLTSNFSYLLEDRVIVGENAASANADKIKLIIDAGTTVFASAASGGPGYLVIDRGGQLHANGSHEKPVIFTYENADAAAGAATGQWGGLALNGGAPLNVVGGIAEGAGNSGEYGGDRADDSSGVLTFVQVKHAGRNTAGKNGASGIAFQGVGSGTLIDYVQVHNSSGDGAAFFGGAANARHILLTGNADDALAWTEGWNGKLQFVAIGQGHAGKHCIEGRSNSEDNDATPRALAVISNITCAGPPDSGGNGFLLSAGTSARISNAVIGYFDAGYCLDIDDGATFAAAGGGIAGLNGSLTLSHSRLAAGCGLDESGGDPFSVKEWFGAQAGSAIGEFDLGGDSGLINGHILNVVAPLIPDDPFFQQVGHIGAIKDATSDWTSGWTHSD